MPDYFVIAEGFQRPAGHKIWKDTNGQRRVTMSEAAAKYWIDQGALSDRPLESHSLHGRAVLAGMTGQTVPAPNEPEAKGRPIK